MKDINYYLQLKYPAEIVETEDGYVASNPDLPGCASFGDTPGEALDSLKEVRELWLEGQFDSNGVAPEPRQPEEFSGRFVVRIPKWLHRHLERESRQQACSLNTLVVSMLSAAVGMGQNRPAQTTEINNAWDPIEETWPMAGHQERKWHITQVGSFGKSRADYINVFHLMGKRKSEEKSAKHSEPFIDNYSKHEKQAN